MARKRKCKNCKQYVSDFVVLPGGVFCSIDSALEFTAEKRKRLYERQIKKQREKAEKERKREHRDRKERLKTRAWHLNTAGQAFRDYIRLRDQECPCISCGRYHNGQYHAGHYLSCGAHPELRFNELNTHKQCAPCNNDLSGNATQYRIRLVQKIGEKYVQWLEGPHNPMNLTIEQIQAIKKYYRKQIKELRSINNY